MNKIVNKFLLARDRFMPEMHWFAMQCIDNLDLHEVLVDHLQKAKTDYKYLKKQEVHNILIKTN